VKVKSPNWHEHTSHHGYRFLGIQPTSTDIHGNQDSVVLTFRDNQADAGLQVCMIHQSFRELATAIAKARETFEAKEEDYRQEEE
jgi:hypothetical protein